MPCSLLALTFLSISVGFLGLWRCFLGLLQLSLHVILGQVAVLALATRVVGLVRVLTARCKLGLALPVVAVVAHVLCVVLLVPVAADEDACWVLQHQVFERLALLEGGHYAAQGV